MRISEQQLPALLNALDEGVVLLDRGEIVWANPAFSRMLGISLAQLEGHPAAEVFADAGGRPLPDPAVVGACCLRDSAGRLCSVSVRPVGPPPADELGDPVGDLIVVIDRSREERLEGEIWRATEQLRADGSRSPADSVLRDEVSGMIEHEIRTASTVIRGYLRLLQEERVGELGAAQREFLHQASRETDRISTLVDDLLDVAASEGTRGLRVSRKPGRLHPVIMQAIKATRPLFAERDLAVSLDLALEDDELSLDADQIERVLINLLVNASKFSPVGSTICVATHLIEADSGSVVAISVLDEGPGVAHADAERIFEPFVRGSMSACAPVEGVGLGLALCSRILEAHGGAIEAIPGLGYGLFRVSLPVEV